MEIDAISKNIEESLALEDFQRDILNGLREIGQEIAILYYDGVKIFRSNLDSKSYLLSHIAREIEGGIRDIFASGRKTEGEKCPQCGTLIKQNKHIDEICQVLGVKKDNEFAQEWHRIAGEFHKYAHRHGAYNPPRDKETFNELWRKFEIILLRLVGNYLNLLTLVDQTLRDAQPTEEMLKALGNLLKNPVREKYFFDKLQFVQWFEPLSAQGYFDPEKAHSPQQAEEEGYFIIPQWNVLPYLERVSQQVALEGNEKYIDELLDIIKNVTEYHVKNNRKLDNYRTWGYFVKILLNLPNDKIVKYIKEHNIKIGKDWIEVWLTSKFDNLVPASDIATKLLTKFLTNNKDDIDIAEQIIDVITDIKPDYFEGEEKAEKLGVFKKKKEPKTIVDSYWLVKSFKENADRIGKLCSKELILSLANRLKKILDKEHNNHQVLIEVNNETYRISAERIDGFDFRFSIARLYKEKVKSLKPEEKIFKILEVPGELLHSFSKTAIRDKETFVQIVRDEIKETHSLPVLNTIQELNKKLNNLYEGLHSDYSYIWYKSLSKEPEIGIHNAEEILVFILKDIFLSKCKNDTQAGKAILKNFLSNEYQYSIFRRLVLLIAGSCWNEYKDFFWKFIEIIPTPFDGSKYEVELYKLFKQNIDKFTLEEKQKINSLISKGPNWLPDEKARQKQYVAYWKQKWYSAMQKDEYFLKLFEKQKAITGEEKIEPPDEKEIFIKWGEGASPLTKEEILKMNNVDLVKYLNEFKTKDSWGGPTEEGLAEVLRSAVKEVPNKFVEELHQFLEVKYKYIYNILYGLEDAWKEKKSFNWGNLFDFVKKYITKENFLEEDRKKQDEDRHPYHIWIINVVADLIQEGTRSDSWAFPEEYFTQAKEIIDILLEILEKLPKKEEITHRDFVTEALNTSYGRVIIAIILFSLRKARVNDKKGDKKDIKWVPDKYNKLLGDEIIEAFTLFGQYLPNFVYLNGPWVEQKIKEFENFSFDDTKWQAFMEGYLYGHRVYQDLYKLMCNHYIKAIEADFGKERTENRLIQHITIGYLRDNESLEGEDSLFKKIIDKWNYTQLNEIIDFFWSQGRSIAEQDKKTEEDEKIKNKIIKFWEWTYKKKSVIKQHLKENYGKFLAELSKLTVLLDKIDDTNSKWLLLSAPYAGQSFDSTFFIEYLDKLTNKESAKFVVDIFLEMLSKSTPTFREEHIKSIVKKIYQFGDKDKADRICNIYGSRGHAFLRPLYEKYNQLIN